MSNLYTGRGDNGITTFFDSAEQYPKSALRVEALGVLDELNAWLGLCKVRAKSYRAGEGSFEELLTQIQHHLFILQAEIGGADKHLNQEKIAWLEATINFIEVELTPITTFFLAGGTELATLLDVARTVARRAERRLVSFRYDASITGAEKGRPNAYALAYLNRLSTLLYALARLVNQKEAMSEEPPNYR